MLTLPLGVQCKSQLPHLILLWQFIKRAFSVQNNSVIASLAAWAVHCWLRGEKWLPGLAQSWQEASSVAVLTQHTQGYSH